MLTMTFLSSNAFSVSNVQNFFESDLNDNIFHGVLNMEQNCANSQYWDSYKFKEQMFYSRIHELDENEFIFQREIEYNIMAKVQRRSNLKGSEIVAVVAVSWEKIEF